MKKPAPRRTPPRGNRFRLLITFPGQDRARRLSTSDLRTARRIARHSARSGDAFVTLQTARRGRFTTARTYSSTLT